MRISNEIQNRTFATMVKNGKIKAERKNGINYLIPLFTLTEFVELYRQLANVKYDPKNPPRRQNGDVISQDDFDKMLRRQIRNNLIDNSCRNFLNRSMFKDGKNKISGTAYAENHKIKNSFKMVEFLLQSDDFVECTPIIVNGKPQPTKTVHVYVLPTGCEPEKKGRRSTPVCAFFDGLEFVEE